MLAPATTEERPRYGADGIHLLYVREIQEENQKREIPCRT
jgi:hypothetical protein